MLQDDACAADDDPCALAMTMASGVATATATRYQYLRPIGHSSFLNRSAPRSSWRSTCHRSHVTGAANVRMLRHQDLLGYSGVGQRFIIAAALAIQSAAGALCVERSVPLR